MQCNRNLCISICILLSLPAFGEDKNLTVVSWGGVYEQSQREVYLSPFSIDHGVDLTVESYSGGLDELQKQVASNKPTWDVVDMVYTENLEACKQGLLEPINNLDLPDSPGGVPASEDFFEGALTRCGVAHVISSVVIAFNQDSFPGEKPSTIEALFDVDRYPGKRALQRQPVANLEWALLSYGIPRKDIYMLLSTERGLKLAFKRLDSIREHIVWWDKVAMPVDMLAAGDVVMASGYNGRLFDQAVVKGSPIEIIWDGQILDYSTWGIVKGSKNLDTARDFLTYATSTDHQAKLTRFISYGPSRTSAINLVWKHTATGIDIRPHLPTSPSNLRKAIRRDQRWYSLIQKRLNQRFQFWLESGDD